jgi:hypothetical protein
MQLVDEARFDLVVTNEDGEDPPFSPHHGTGKRHPLPHPTQQE